MKKNQWMLWMIPALMLSHLGFDWNTQAAEKKGGASEVSSMAQASANRGGGLPFPQMMGALSQNMTLWPALSLDNKKKAVEAAILLFRDRQNAAILRPADFYAGQIDEALSRNPEMQNVDLVTVVKMMAVMQYDFYNGQNKDALAKEVLGEKAYESIRTQRK